MCVSVSVEVGDLIPGILMGSPDRGLSDCCLNDGEVMCVSVCGGWRSDPRETNGISRLGPD